MFQSSNFKKAVFGLSVMVVLLCLQSCILEKKDKEVITEVLDEFSIEMIEQLGDTRQLIFEFESVEMEPCLNSTIDRTVVFSDNKISILLEGIVPANDCNPGLAPATSTGNAGKLNTFNYDFDITIRNTVINEGKIKVNGEKYEINLTTSDGIVIEDNILYKIPENSIWGYVGYDDETVAGSGPNDFLADLADLTKPKNLTKGQYGYFKMMDNSKISLREAPSFNHINTFFFEFIGEKTDLVSLLDFHRSSPVGANMEIVVYTSDGETL